MSLNKIKEIQYLASLFDFYSYGREHILFHQKMKSFGVVIGRGKNIYFSNGHEYQSFDHLKSYLEEYFGKERF